MALEFAPKRQGKMASRSERMVAMVARVHDRSTENKSLNDEISYHAEGPQSQRSPKKPMPTDFMAIWERPLDFNDHSIIFDYNNEYKNSSSTVNCSDISKLKKSFQSKSPLATVDQKIVAVDLLCAETMPNFEEDHLQANDSHLYNDSDDSVKDKDFVPNSSDSESSDTDTECEKLLPRSVTTNLERLQDLNDSYPTNSLSAPSSHTETICDNQEIPTVTIITTENCNEFPPSRLPQKRRKFETSLAERNKIKLQAKIAKLTIKPPCLENCRLKCCTKFTLDQRQIINEQYAKLDNSSQGVFIKGCVDSNLVKTRKQTDKMIPKRTVTYRYFLTDSDCSRVEVCKTFFLATLGYNSKNDQKVLKALKRAIDNQHDHRGSYERLNVIDRKIIKDHILSYNPSISHYRREHAPNKLYLPSDLTVTFMHKQFLEKYPDITVSQETYRLVVRNEMNISFAHLGNEECELCELFSKHISLGHPNDYITCEVCTNYNKHKKRYTDSRIKYQEDVEKAKTDQSTVYYSVDLQKVMMLPRMDQFKASIFCHRIIAFNESFVPLGKTTKHKLPYAVIWNESVAGRSQYEIISAVRYFLIQKRDAEHVIFWMDNCSSQNKNWALMSFLVDVVNSALITTKSIEIRYFEPGHTFMSADHFHHQVEQMIRNKKVYDFSDFEDNVRMANSRKVIVKSMEVSDFFVFQDLSSQHYLRNLKPRVYLKDIMVIRVNRGQFHLLYKNQHNDLEYKPLDFIQKKIIKNGRFPPVTQREAPRGILDQRKNEIIQKLVPLMPESRRHFWLNIPSSSNTAPLTDCE